MIYPELAPALSLGLSTQIVLVLNFHCYALHIKLTSLMWSSDDQPSLCPFATGAKGGPSSFGKGSQAWECVAP